MEEDPRYLQYLPPVNEVWGKTMFLHVSVILSKGEGGLYDVTSCLDAWSRDPFLSLVPRSFGEGGLSRESKKRAVRILCFTETYILSSFF